MRVEGGGGARANGSSRAFFKGHSSQLHKTIDILKSHVVVVFLLQNHGHIFLTNSLVIGKAI